MKDGLYLKCNCCGRIKRKISKPCDLYENKYGLDYGCRIYDKHYDTLSFCETNNNTILKVINNKVTKRYKSIKIEDLIKLNNKIIYFHIKSDNIDSVCKYINDINNKVLKTLDNKYKNLSYEDVGWFLCCGNMTAYVELK